VPFDVGTTGGTTGGTETKSDTITAGAGRLSALRSLRTVKADLVESGS